MEMLDTIKTSNHLASKPIDILIVDDSPRVRLGLKAALSSDPELRVSSQCRPGKNVALVTRILNPDIVLMDIDTHKHGTDGFTAIRLIKKEAPNSHIIVFTSDLGAANAKDAFAAGAEGCCLRESLSTDLSSAIKAVHGRKVWLDPRIGMSEPSSLTGRTNDEPIHTVAHLVSAGCPSQDASYIDPSQLFAQRYRLEQRLGKGGMGLVFKATHLAINRTVAIKVLAPELACQPDMLAHFEKEAQALRQLNHANIVTFYDYGVTNDGTPYIVMDHVDGIPLDKAIRGQASLNPKDIMSILSQICDGLAAIHGQGIIHCDIKPGNIMVRKDYRGNYKVQIVDFGLARATSVERSDSFIADVTGSPQFMSPEQCCNGFMDKRSDIYSFGCLMYQLLSGHPVFDGPTPYDIFAKHLSDQPKPFHASYPHLSVPKELEDITFKALQKDPAERFQSIGELKQTLALACDRLWRRRIVAPMSSAA
jgi:DNA-binding NarL/FixJ family response regulator